MYISNELLIEIYEKINYQPIELIYLKYFSSEDEKKIFNTWLEIEGFKKFKTQFWNDKWKDVDNLNLISIFDLFRLKCSSLFDTKVFNSIKKKIKKYEYLKIYYNNKNIL